MSQSNTQSKHYLAPRQGRFAMLLLISCVFHVLAFIIVTERNLNAQEAATISALSARIADEVQMPLSANDMVSLAVIANNYKTDPAIAYIGIYNAQGELLVPAGEDVATQPQTIVIGSESAELGKVVIKPITISKAQIFTQNWLFFVITALLHLMIWLLYAHLARPTTQLVKEIGDDASKATLARVSSTKTEQYGSLNAAHSHGFGGGQNEEMDAEMTTDASESTAQDLRTMILDSSNNALLVRFAYADSQLLDLLMDEQAHAYLTFCNQLLEKTLKHLLQHASLAGVESSVLKYFDSNGAIVKLQAPKHDRSLMAAIMLVKVFAMVHQIAYKKHRDNGNFALPIKAIATNSGHFERASHIVNRRSELSLAMLDDFQIREISRYIMSEHIEATNADEQNCYLLKDDSTPAMARILEGLRKSILSA